MNYKPFSSFKIETSNCSKAHKKWQSRESIREAERQTKFLIAESFLTLPLKSRFVFKCLWHWNIQMNFTHINSIFSFICACELLLDTCHPWMPAGGRCDRRASPAAMRQHPGGERVPAGRVRGREAQGEHRRAAALEPGWAPLTHSWHPPHSTWA